MNSNLINLFLKKGYETALYKTTSEDDKSKILRLLNDHKDMENSLAKKSLDSAKELRDKILDNINSESDVVNTSQSVEVTAQSITNSVSESVTSAKNTVDVTDISDINESNIFGFFTEFTDLVKKELSTLNSEELACLFNSLGFLMIFFAFTSIVTVLFGEFIINKLQLETRFPRLAKIIKLRKTISKYSLLFNIVLVYLIILIFIYVNISMILS